MLLTIYDFDLTQICNSGQCFRWQQLDENTFLIPAFGRTLTVRQDGHRFDFSCGSTEFDAVWRSYFDLDTDYAAIKARIDPDDEYLCRSAQHGWGMRILRQDLWEILVSFIISQNNNIPRIRKNLASICTLSQGDFPSPELLAATAPDVFRSMGLGYRADYLCAAGEYARRDGALDALRTLSFAQAHQELRTIKGVGPKVADCVCLFGLHHVDAFPLDTHVKQILKAHYPGGFPFERYAGCAGILQQYMFYYDLEKNP